MRDVGWNGGENESVGILGYFGADVFPFVFPIGKDGKTGKVKN